MPRITVMGWLMIFVLIAKPAIVVANPLPALRPLQAGPSSVIDPVRIAAQLRAQGHLELELPGSVTLSGDWTFPRGSLTVRASGEIHADGLRLSAPGLHLHLEGASVRVREGTRFDLAERDGAGGEVSLVATSGDDGVVELASSSVVDVSGASGQGGRILLSASDVRAHGSLLARGEGSIEVEARSGLRFSGPADTAGGLIRLDPSNMIIGNFAGADANVANGTSGGSLTRSPSANTGQLDAGNLAALLASNDVIVHTVANGTATGIALPVGFPGTPALDATGGDIDVQGDVVWASTHFLWLLAQDDLVVRAKVQNAGGGSVVGVAGWDGSTFSGLDLDPLPASVYGAGTGDAYVLGPDGLSASPTFGIAFGSRLGPTVLAARNVRVQGSTDSNSSNGWAMVGYRVNSAGVDASGDIRVLAKGSVSVLGGINAGNYRSAQIGHGGCINDGVGSDAIGSAQGNLSGTIVVDAAGLVEVMSGTRYSYGQIGNGGCVSMGSTRGNLSGSIHVTGDAISIEHQSAGVTAPQTFAMVGNGGMQLFGHNTTGTVGGDIRVETTGGDLLLLPTLPAGMTVVNEARIGNGGLVDTTFDNGNSPLVRSSLGAQSGDITVVVARDLVMEGGTEFNSYSQIGHGGYILAAGLVGPASGGIDVTVGRDAVMRSTSTIVGNPRPAQIGHGGATRAIFVPAGGLPTSERKAISGPIKLTVGRELHLLPGVTQVSYTQVGHGGLLWTEQSGTVASLESADGDITVQASSIEMRGSTGTPAETGLSYPQIGNGGPSILLASNSQAHLGPVSGTIRVTTTGITCLAASALPCGDLVLTAGTAAGGGNYAWIGHGGEPFDIGAGAGTQVSARGDVIVTVAKEANLVNGPTDFWHIGHLLLAPTLVSDPRNIINSNVSLDTATLDFTEASTSASATINDPRFWPQYVHEAPAPPGIDYSDNVDGGSVSLRVRGNAGNDGAVVVQQPLVVPSSAAHPVVVRSTDDLTLSAAMTNNGSSFLDLVDDDATANQTSPNLSLTALFTIGAGGSIAGTGSTRLFAVRPAQIVLGSYVPPANAFGVWYQTAGSPVVGANFKSVGADLAITKNDGVTSAAPGGSVTYAITATNAGPGNALGAMVADTFPAVLTCTWTCVGAGGGTCTPAGSGNINDAVTLPALGSVTYTASCTISAAATGALSNTATVTAPAAVTDPNPGNDSATDTDTLAASADLAITKTDGVTLATPGSSVTYTITASNSGPSNAPAASVSDTFPASLNCTWTCGGAGGGTCAASGSGNIGEAVNLPSGGSVTYLASCTVSAAAVGTLSNTAMVAAPGGVTDPTPGNNLATDSDTLAPQADLAITKTDGVSTAIPGGSVSYAITASNSGPSNIAAATVNDTFPASLTCTWTCAGASGGTCTASGSGNLGDTVNLPSGASVTYTASCTIAPSASGTLSNTATVTVSAGATDSVPGNNSATDADTLTPQADLAITKTDGATTAPPGGSVTYTIVASNVGPSDALGATVNDSFPASLACSWTCVGTGGGTCAPAGSGNIGDTVNLPSGASANYTASCAISAAASGTLSNTATVTASAGVTDPSPGNNSATDSDTLAPQADLAITKTDGMTTATPGGSVTYAVTASNAGPSGATGAIVADTFPAALSCSWTCVGGGGGLCAASGSGNVNDAVSLPAGGSVTYTVSCAVSAAASGTLSNTATVTAPAGVTDPTLGNNSATDTDTLGPAPNVAISATKSVTGSFAPGGAITYIVVLSNTGNAAQADNPGDELTDVLPTDLTLVSASATAGVALATPATRTVIWNGSIPVGGSVTITIQAGIAVAETPGTTISNQATIAFDGDVNGDNEGSLVSDDPSVTGSDDPTRFVVAGLPVAAIPTLGGYGLIALASLLGAVGALASSRQRVTKPSSTERS